MNFNRLIKDSKEGFKRKISSRRKEILRITNKYDILILKYSIKGYIDIIKSHTFKLLFFVLILSIIYTVASKASTDIIITVISLNLITLLLYVFALHFFKNAKVRNKPNFLE